MKKIGLLVLLLMVGLLTACTNQEETNEFNLDSNITVYTRDTTSGTRDGFMNGIGFGEAAKSDDVLVEGFVIKDNTAILNAMSIDEYGIGYVSLSSVNDSIKGLSFEGVAPTEANVMNNTYGLKRPFNWMVNNEGAIALPTTVTWDSIKAQHPITNQDNSDVTVRFGGSDSIQKVAEALTEAFTAKAGNFVAEHDHTGSGDGWKRTNDPAVKDTTVGKDVGFASRPFTSTELANVTEDQSGQLAWDAIVAIVHLNNPITNMTADTLKKIYNGTFTTWSQVPSAA